MLPYPELIPNSLVKRKPVQFAAVTVMVGHVKVQSATHDRAMRYSNNWVVIVPHEVGF